MTGNHAAIVILTEFIFEKVFQLCDELSEPRIIVASYVDAIPCLREAGQNSFEV